MRLIFMGDFSEQFPNRILRGIRKYSQEADEPWVVCTMPSSYRETHCFEDFLAWAQKWRANIVLAPFNPDDPVEKFRENGIVAISMDHIRPLPQIPSLTSDYHRTGEMVATRFVASGYRNFAFFGYHGVVWSDGRREGFVDYLDSQGLKDYYEEGVRIRTDVLWSYDEAKLGYWLLSLPKPVGIMACDDTQANILLECCNTFEIAVPGEIAVIGVDNDDVRCTMTQPQLSSVDVDMEGGGYAVASMAARMVEDPSYKGENIVMQPLGIVTRQSSGIVVTGDRSVQEAIRFIAENPRRKIQVSDVLSHVPMSRRSLEQRFLKATGLSVYEFITKVRMDTFAELLLTTTDTVSQIAALMDEPDTKSISRRFAAIKGCTPREYRRKYLRKMSE